MFLDYFLPLFTPPVIIAFLAAFFSTPLVIRIYRKYGLVDDPSHHKHAKVTHQIPVPRGGGIPVFLGLFFGACLFLTFNKQIFGLLLGAFILTIVGILDDKYDLNPYLRLITCLIAALCVVGSGIGIAYITDPFGAPGSVIQLSEPQITINLFGHISHLWVISDIFALVWIVWMINIVNWSKGLDGQMPGFVAMAALFMALFSLRFASDPSQWQIIRLAAITTGSFLGLLYWNFYPQKIMPGYAGGSLAGYLLAVLSIFSVAKVGAMVLVLALPTMDAVYTIIRRLSSGRSPVWGDRGHFHHLLLDSGWSKPRVALFYWSVTLLLGLIALQLNSTQKLFTIAMAGLVVGGLILWLNIIIHLEKDE